MAINNAPTYKPKGKSGFDGSKIDGNATIPVVVDGNSPANVTYDANH